MAQQPNKHYFSSTAVVDWQQPEVFAVAQEIAAQAITPEELVHNARRWMACNIAHSEERSAVSCSASEVLRLAQGSSFSQSHLMAALLRANGLATSFCYQRLNEPPQGPQLQGYCTVWLSGFGWYPLHVASPESVAYGSGEFHYRIYSAAPLPEVVKVLSSASSWAAARQALPTQISMG